MDKKKLLRALAVVLVVVAAGVWVRSDVAKQVQVGVAAIRERIAIDTSDDSYIWNGADVIVYSDNHSTQKIRLIGESGDIDATGVITADGGLVITGNLSDENGSFRINDNVLVTGTLGVSSQVNAANGVAVTGGITATGALTVTSWGRFYGLVLQPALAQVVTASYGITPGNYSLLFLADDGGQASGQILLDDTVGIVDGTYQGQILVIVWTDTDGAELELDDGANVQFEGAKDLQLGAGESAMFIWTGTDWAYLGGGELVAGD